MNITSDVKDAKLTATVTIPAADVEAVVKKAYKDAAQKYNFPGFRRGKAPRRVIDSMLGADAIMAQATNELLASNEGAVLTELDIVPIKEGNYENVELARDGEDFTYTVEFTLRPQPGLSSYEPVEIEMPPAEVTDAEIDAQVDMFLAYSSSFEDVERGIEGEDYVTLDIESVKNADHLAGEGRMFAMNADSLPADFAAALMGMKAGEEKEISWTLENEEEASAKVVVKNVKERKVPELTDEFVKENFEFESIAAMRDAISIEVKADKDSKLPGVKEARCVAALSDRLELEGGVDPEYEQSVFTELGQTFLQQLSARGITADAWLQANGMTYEAFFADLHKQAVDVARENLALDALARELNIELTAEDVDAEFAAAAVEDVEATKAQFVADGRMAALRDSIRRSKAVNWLVENAKVTEVDEYAKAAAEKDAE